MWSVELYLKGAKYLISLRLAGRLHELESKSVGKTQLLPLVLLRIQESIWNQTESKLSTDYTSDAERCNCWVSLPRDDQRTNERYHTAYMCCCHFCRNIKIFVTFHQKQRQLKFYNVHLFSDKACCLSQSERGLYGNFIMICYKTIIELENIVTIKAPPNATKLP